MREGLLVRDLLHYLWWDARQTFPDNTMQDPEEQHEFHGVLVKDLKALDKAYWGHKGDENRKDVAYCIAYRTVNEPKSVFMVNARAVALVDVHDKWRKATIRNDPMKNRLLDWATITFS